MADLWLPGYTRMPLGLAGGGYADTARPTLEWHTTEGRSVKSAVAAYRPYPPHLCVDPATGERVQHIPLNRHAYANRSDRSDREFVIQVEVVGFAGQSHLWADARLRWLGQHVVRPVRAAVGVPDVVVWHGFHGEGEGIVLASPRSPIRLSDTQLRNFAGHLGHQHMPPPDEHWDPGRLSIRKILTYSQEDDDVDPSLAAKLNTLADHYLPGEAGVRTAGPMALAIINTQSAVMGLTDDETNVVAAIRGLSVGQVDVPALAAALVPLLPGGTTPEQLAQAVADEQDKRARDSDPTTGSVT